MNAITTTGPKKPADDPPGCAEASADSRFVFFDLVPRFRITGRVKRQEVKNVRVLVDIVALGVRFVSGSIDAYSAMMKFLLFTAMTPLAGGLIKLNARDRSRTAGNQNMSKEEKSPLAVAENIWVIKYPLTLLGLEFGRAVTLVRLASGTGDSIDRPLHRI